MLTCSKALDTPFGLLQVLNSVLAPCRPGWENRHQIASLQLVVGAINIIVVERFFLWGHFVHSSSVQNLNAQEPQIQLRGLLLPQLPAAASLIVMVSLEGGAMGGFAAALSKYTFKGTSFWQVASVVHQSLLLTQMTAHLVQGAVARELGLVAGLGIATAVHGSVAILVMSVIPRFPGMLIWFAFISQVWAYVAGATLFTMRFM